MEIIQWIGNHLPALVKFIGIICSVIAGLFTVYKYTNKPIRTAIKLVNRVLYEFSDNGGGSIKDKVGKLVELTEGTSLNVTYLRQRQSSLLDELPYPFFENDANGVCVFVNKAWVETTGLSFDLAVGHGYERIIYKDDLPKLKDDGENYRADGKDYEGRFRMVHWVTKEVFLVHCTASKIEDNNGNLLGIIGKLHKV